MTLLPNRESARVLGCLVEKEITTPEYYPLSLNALVNACNQKSNREPAMSLDEDAVRLALRNLSDRGLARQAKSEGRVPKFEHDVYNALQLGRREIAILCELLLRGPQTAGELRVHAERMYPLESIDDIHATVQRLIQHDPPLATILAKQPGTKETRYAHTMLPVDAVAPPAQAAPPHNEENDRLTRLEEQVRELRQAVQELQQQIASLAKPSL